MLVSTAGRGQQTNALTTLRQAYQKQQQSAFGQYEKAVDAFMAEAKRQGDLGGVLLLQAEKKRLDVEKTVPAPKEAQGSFRPAAEAYCQAMTTLLGQYSKALDGLVKKEVTADRIEEAKVIKAEKDNADLMLADMQARLLVKTDVNTETKLASRTKAEAGRVALTLPASFLKECVLCYSFDKDEGDNVVDLSAKKHNGRLRGATFVRDGKGANTVCEFMEGTSIDSRPSDLSSAAYRELTLALWVKSPGASGQQQLVGRTDGGTSYQTPGSYGLVLGLAGNHVATFHFNDGRDQRLDFDKEIGQDKWCHLTAVLMPNGTAAGYLDGERVFFRTGFSKIPELPNGFFRVGRWDNAGYPFHFKGPLDDVRIYRRALSDGEVKQLYNAQKKAFCD